MKFLFNLKNALAGGSYALAKDALTILVPTKGRPAELGALLRHFAQARIPHKIIVLLTGKARGYMPENLGHLDVQVLEFSEDTTLFTKLKAGLGKVTTELTALCTDDDIVLPDALQQCGEFLLQNQAYSAAQGYHIAFSEEHGAVNLQKVDYFTPSIEADEPLLRLNALLRRYQEVTWAVFRSAVVKDAISQASAYSNIMFNELLWSSIAVIKGRVKRLPVVYCLRRLGPVYMMGHPLFGMMENPQRYFEEYARYRAALLRFLLPHSSLSEAEMGRAVDLIHCCMFGREFETGPLNYFTNAVLADPKTSLLNPDVARVMRPPMPDLSSGWAKELSHKGITFRFFPDVLDPQPKEEIQLPENLEQALMKAVSGYFKKAHAPVTALESVG